MNFNSQICTTKEQSERLLSLGLKKETADMYYPNGVQDSEHIIRAIYPAFWESDRKIDAFIRGKVTPAWSLHRLIEMLPKRIKNIKEGWDMCSHDIAFVITEELDVSYEEPFEDEPCYNKYFREGNLYAKVVNCIEWLIKEGHFNKEYLE